MMRKKTHSIKIALLIVLIVSMSLACKQGSVEEGMQVDTMAPSPIVPADAEKYCGDGICEGPENVNNCPQDCEAAAVQAELPTQKTDTADLSACELPNPRHAVVSEELFAYQNVLVDGGFENDTAEIIISEHFQSDLRPADIQRSREAAYSGNWGYRIQADTGQGSSFGIKTDTLEKGEDIRFSFWARSFGGQTKIRPLVFWVENEADWGKPYIADVVPVGEEWAQVHFVTSTRANFLYAVLSFEVGPGISIDVDDMQVEASVWCMADYEGSSRQVGGVVVPSEPVAPLHINFLVHIEDPNLLQVNQVYFRQQSAILIELARIFHQHGGFLTIQTEQDWPMGAEKFEPGLLADLSQQYGVQYSNHTHGPNCRDERGELRSAADCQPDWEKDLDDDAVIEYARQMAELLESASGQTITDHNGNFDYAPKGRFAEVPIYTMSAYKDKNTQRTYDYLINNPWRPAEVDGLLDVEGFLTHDPNTELVYIPGWGQAISRHPQHTAETIRPALSQFIRYVSPDRINTFYVVSHVGFFYSRTGNQDSYIVVDKQSNQVIYSDEFLSHLDDYDAMLSEVFDPLVAEGYLTWTSFSDIYELYTAWEEACP